MSSQEPGYISLQGFLGNRLSVAWRGAPTSIWGDVPLALPRSLTLRSLQLDLGSAFTDMLYCTPHSLANLLAPCIGLTELTLCWGVISMEDQEAVVMQNGGQAPPLHMHLYYLRHQMFEGDGLLPRLHSLLLVGWVHSSVLGFVCKALDLMKSVGLTGKLVMPPT